MKNADLLEKVTSLVDQELEVSDIKKEISKLTVMLKLGFTKKFDGSERISRVLASGDGKKIGRYYDFLANQIKGIILSGNYKQFADYVKVNHSLSFDIDDDFPTVEYNAKGKKRQKFEDLYNDYFSSPPPKSPKEAAGKILSSIETLSKEIKNLEEPIKEELKAIIEDCDGEHTPSTIKTINRLIKTSKSKDEPLENILNDLNDSIASQEAAVTFLEEVDEV